MELACGNTSSACRRYFCPVVRSSIATPRTPSRLRSTSAIEASSFCHNTCCLFGVCAKHVASRRMTAAKRLNVEIPPKDSLRKKSEKADSLRFRSGQDRKSTRLNSSHEWISYAVFCLKKKNKQLIS